MTPEQQHYALSLLQDAVDAMTDTDDYGQPQTDDAEEAIRGFLSSFVAVRQWRGRDADA